MAEQSQPKPKMIKVKMLRQVGNYSPGAEVELPEDVAMDLCQPSKQQVGAHVNNLQKAVRVEDFDKLKDTDVDISMLTQHEMNERGLVNRIASPYDTHPAEKALENSKKLEEGAKVKDGDDEKDKDKDKGKAKPQPK